MMLYLSEIIDSLTSIIFVIDIDGKILDRNQLSNDLIVRIFKDKPTSFFDFFDFFSQQQFKDYLKKLSDGERCRFKIKLEKDDGRIYEFNCRKILGGDHFIILGKDITEQEQKEIELLRFSEAINQTVNPIQITDSNGRMIYVNPAFEKVCGYSQNELIGKNPNLLSSHKLDKRFWEKVWQTILSGRVWIGEVQNKKKNGEIYFTELLISPIVGKEGTVLGFLGSHRDINEKKMLELQLARSQKLETIGTLSAGIAHEVGNPLTSISSIVQILQRTVHDNFAQEKLELVRTQITRITSIIRQLVDFSRPSNYEIKMVDIHATLRNALNIVQYGRKISNINFVLNFASELPNVPAIPDQLIQVFINILMNAVDSCGKDSGAITISTITKQHSIEIILVDTGCGIEVKDLNKVFDPFYSTKEVGKGTGLGLWISLGIIKGFGGDIRVSSTLNVGTIFTIELPLKGNVNVT